MSRVRGRDTKPEMRVRRLLHRAGYRFRLHRGDLPGSPDLFLPRYRLAVFVHGCFWHGHEDCKRSKLPKTRIAFWETKISANRTRDARVLKELAGLGIQSVTLWECQLKDDNVILEKISRATDRSTGADDDKEI